MPGIDRSGRPLTALRALSVSGETDRHRHHRRRHRRHLRRRLSRRGRAKRHRHRPHRHLRGDQFRQCRRARLLRRAAARPQGHDAAICRNGLPTRSGRSSIPPAYLPKLLPWLCPLLARRRARPLRGEPRGAGGADEARRSRMGGADGSAPARRPCCARTARSSSTRARPSSRPRCPAGRRATASASSTGISSSDELAGLSAGPVAALRPRHLRARLEDRQRPEDSRQGDLALCRSERARRSSSGDVGLAMPSKERHRDPAQATGARSWRGSW